MRILISGVCGFAGTTLAHALAQSGTGDQISGFDNFIRPGSETNRAELKRLGIRTYHSDQRSAADWEMLPACDWVIDAAANPSVLAGVDGQSSSRQLVEHNLVGTFQLLEYAKRHRAGIVLLSTSRVYSIAPLAALKLEVVAGAFRPREEEPAFALRASAGGDPGGLAAGAAAGISGAGIAESFPTLAPISLYGATKLASEALALEYGETFDLPVFVNRCGVLAGAGQFGRADQGIFTFWLNRWLRRVPLTYLGFGGHGHQVRDCLHPRDLVPLLRRQFGAPRLGAEERIVNVAGGAAAALSLRQLSDWCAEKWGPRTVAADPAPRPFDLPWVVLDAAKAARLWDWRPQMKLAAILEEIGAHAEAHPQWLDLSAAF